uniref:Branchless trichome n=1 Tax=Kalanchoe fedtschenkoi TaxID=63787 RepID=A0A7N0T833_KALFE
MAMMSGSNESFSRDPLTIHTAPSWNLYDNPCYNSCYVSAKVRESFRDLTGCKPGMDSDLDRARAQIMELKSELELERKVRRRAESANRKLLKEVGKERKAREELAGECHQLEKEVEIARSEMGRLRVEFENERKMMKMVEVLREERVQMKLTEANLLYEEKYKKLVSTAAGNERGKSENGVQSSHSSLDKSTAAKKISSGHHRCGNIAIFSSAEPENPHIKQGIKGFVEFPKVIQAMGSKKKLMGTKLESQKAQICILLKQNSSIKSTKLVTS